MNEKQQKDLAQFVKKCEQNSLDLAYYKELYVVNLDSKPEPEMHPLLILGVGILAGSALTAAIVGATR